MNSNTQNKITYIEKDGIFYPNLTLPEQTDYLISKYGGLHVNTAARATAARSFSRTITE